MAGDIEQAEDWAKLLANTRADNPDLLAAQQNYALVFSLLNNNLRLEALRNWWKIQPDQAAALRIVTVLEGAGLAIPPEFWLEIQNNFDDSVVPQGQGPGPLWLRLVAQSLEWNESGRALLTLITPLAQIGPAELNATGISNLLAGLRYLQREDAAKALALHALLDVTE